MNHQYELFCLFLAVSLVAATFVGCSGDSGEEEQKAEANDRQAEIQHVEAHQWCSVAGEADGDSERALVCFGAHDLSGFEADADDEITWEPGAFQVVAE